MPVSTSERQTLLGPLVVGCLLGVFVASAVFAFASEYRLQGSGGNWWQIAAEAVFGFIASTLATVGLLGLLPIAIHRLPSKGNSDA